MREYIYISFWLGALAVCVRLCQLSWADYPRGLTYSRGEDVLGLLIHGGFMGWAAWLLWLT